MRRANSASLAVVCFAEIPKLDFGRLATDFGGVLGAAHAVCTTETRGSDALAFFDIEGTRIGLGYRDMADGPAPRGATHAEGESDPAASPLDVAAVLVVSVGGDGITVPRDDCPFHENRYALCARVIDRIEAAHEVAMLVWLEERREFTGELFDAIVAAVTNPASADSPPARAAARVAAPPPAGAAAAALLPAAPSAPPPPRGRGAGPFAVDTARDAPQAGPPPAQPRPEPTGHMTLPHRLTIYTIGATLMVIALPVGAALMTYFALGRENLTLAARAMALTGTAVGAAQLLRFEGLLRFLG